MRQWCWHKGLRTTKASTAIEVLTAKSMKNLLWFFYVLVVLTRGVALTAIVVFTATSMEKHWFFFVLVVDRVGGFDS